MCKQFIMSGANDTESADVTIKVAANVCFTHLKPVTPNQQHPQPDHAQNVLCIGFMSPMRGFFFSYLIKWELLVEYFCLI